MVVYISKENDVIDLILWKYYKYNIGNERYTAINHLFPHKAEDLPNDYINKVYELNPTLSFYDSYLPAGIEIILPDFVIEKIESPKSAWGAI